MILLKVTTLRDGFIYNRFFPKLDKKISANNIEDFKLDKKIFGHLIEFSKSKKIINNYYNSLFPWLERCEKIFSFNLKGYSNIRIYAFLAERYQSYWFEKYTKPLLWPVIFYDIAKTIK